MIQVVRCRWCRKRVHVFFRRDVDGRYPVQRRHMGDRGGWCFGSYDERGNDDLESGAVLALSDRRRK